MKKMSFAAGLGAALFALGAASAGFAADVPPPPEESLWHGDLTIYGWAPMVGGKVGVNGYGPFDIPSGSGDIDAILKALDGVFMGNASLRYGDFGVFGDLVWVDLSKGNTSPRDYVSAQADLSALIGTVAGTYALIDTPDGHLDALAGVRFWSVNAGFDLNDGKTDFHVGDTINWVDPLIGLRGHYDLSHKVFVAGTGAVGGFGVGSDFMWDVAASIGYNFNDHFSGSLGYRALGVNYSNNGDVVDITSHGPVIALTGRF
jgi:hypothetical protein